jgi:hypothetical protein
MNTLSTTTAVEIIRENFPVFFKDNMWCVVSVCMDNEEWCDRLADKSEGDLLFLADVSHDIMGISNGLLGLDPFPEHFLPRI